MLSAIRNFAFSMSASIIRTTHNSRIYPISSNAKTEYIFIGILNGFDNNTPRPSERNTKIN